jgi:hypothetical protein
MRKKRERTERENREGTQGERERRREGERERDREPRGEGGIVLVAHAGSVGPTAELCDSSCKLHLATDTQKLFDVNKPPPCQ